MRIQQQPSDSAGDIFDTQLQVIALHALHAVQE